ncbi:MAG: haloacid dehalogenase-like hydrolase [Burkholderiaceae bacterium]|nr:haloacid dehalogenase-like hydrolase [Burkholderiaceae bacterium]
MSQTIAVVFDFDDTLAPDSTSSFLESAGIDVPAFWRDEVQPLVANGWDPIPAYLYRMIELAKKGRPITKAALVTWARKLKPFSGATRVFDRVRRHAKSIHENVRVEFYLVSSGIGDIVRNTRIAVHFDDIWTCDFHYDENEVIAFPKNVVSFTDKTRYLFQISKGVVGPGVRGKPFDVNKKVDAPKLHVPLDQMVFVGDGLTDVPCFSLVRKNGGIAIGVFDQHAKDKWGKAWGFIEDGRVSNLVPADFRKDSALSISLMMAVESMARKIRLREQTYQG